jgi:elongation factor P
MAALIEAIALRQRCRMRRGAYHCLDVDVSTPTARGGQTLVRVKMRNLLTRAVFDKTFRASEKLKELRPRVVPVRFSTPGATATTSWIRRASSR